MGNVNLKRKIIVVINDKGAEIAIWIKQHFPEYKIHASSKISKSALNSEKADFIFDDLRDHFKEIYKKENAIIGVMAVGILVRMVAPLLADKKFGAPIIAVDINGKYAIPLFEGHMGANDIASNLSKKTGLTAIITSHAECLYEAINYYEYDYYFHIENEKEFLADFAKGVSFTLYTLDNGGERAVKRGEYDFKKLEKVGLKFSYNQDDKADNSKKILICNKAINKIYNQSAYAMIIQPKNLYIGAGAIKYAPDGALIDFIYKIFAENELSTNSIASIATINIKAFEAAIRNAAKHFNVPFLVYSKDEINKHQAEIINKSDYVFDQVGVYGVAEGAALASFKGDSKNKGSEAGENEGNNGRQNESVFLIEKQKAENVTMAVIEKSQSKNNINKDDNNKHKMGKLFVVGIGPGDECYLTNQAEAAIFSSEHIVGYSLYLDLIADKIRHKNHYNYKLGEERKRVEKAVELSSKGKNVAIISSGDVSIYAMASLVFEVIEGRPGIVDNLFDIEIVPGISAFQLASSLGGSMIGHDFCTISLSNLLTPFSTIKKRLKFASKADFVIAIYNPISKTRAEIFKKSLKIIKKYKKHDALVLLAKNLGRKGEMIKYLKLCELKASDVDMMTILLIGNIDSKLTYQGGIKKYGYTPRGYGNKA